MTATLLDLAQKLAAPGLYEAAAPFNWALKVHGEAVPVFVTLQLPPEPDILRVRLLLLDGWQTFHDYIRGRMDRSFGVISSPIELPHYELLTLRDGTFQLLRHDPAYMPAEVEGDARLEKLCYQIYGVMLRMEGDRSLALKYSCEKSVFSRIEGAPGVWEDAALAIPPPAPYVERIVLSQQELSNAKDLPFDANETLLIDFRLLTSIMSCEPRPRIFYVLLAASEASGEVVLSEKFLVTDVAEIKKMWETLAARVLRRLQERGSVPGRIKVLSPRVFRFLRPLGMELPFKISLHDQLPLLEKLYREVR